MKTLLIRFFAVVSAVCAVVVVSVGAQAPASSDNVKKLLAEKACVGCSLAGASLSVAELGGADLTAANLFEANLYFADLTKANLSGANLVNANLGKARLKDADLRGADLSGANLQYATDVNLDGATTTSATTCPDGSAGPCR